MLGPKLFLIFINDLDQEAARAAIVVKFADDTKVAQPISCEQNRDALQAALDRLVSWADKWGMAFNVAKCKVMHIGHGNPRYDYAMLNMDLAATTEERDLGVITSSKLKPTAQCAKAAKTAQAVLGQLARAFHFRDRYCGNGNYKSC